MPRTRACDWCGRDMRKGGEYVVKHKTKGLGYDWYKSTVCERCYSKVLRMTLLRELK